MRQLISCCAFLMQTTYCISVFRKFIAICLRVLRLVIALCCLIWIYNGRPRRAFVCAAANVTIAATPTFQHLQHTSPSGWWTLLLQLQCSLTATPLGHCSSRCFTVRSSRRGTLESLGEVSNRVSRFWLLSRLLARWLAAPALVNFARFNFIFAALFFLVYLSLLLLSVALYSCSHNIHSDVAKSCLNGNIQINVCRVQLINWSSQQQQQEQRQAVVEIFGPPKDRPPKRSNTLWKKLS